MGSHFYAIALVNLLLVRGGPILSQLIQKVQAASALPLACHIGSGLVAWTKLSSSEALVRMPFVMNPKLLQLMLLGLCFKFLPSLLSHVGFDLLLHLSCSTPVLGPPCDIKCEPSVCSAAPGL